MINKKIVQSIALICSITLVSLFVAYRSGYFDKHEKQKQSPISFTNTKIDSSTANTFEANKNDSIKKDSPIIVSYEPLDHDFLKINFEDMIKKAKLQKDTVEVELPDSLFLVDEQSFFIKDRLINKVEFENFMYQNLSNAYYKKSNLLMSSSKSMAVFGLGEKFINFKNFKFKYNKTIPEKYLLNANHFKSNLYNIWPTKKVNGFTLTEDKTNPDFFKDSPKINMDEMLLSSKSGYIILKDDFKKDSIKNVMGSSKSKAIFSKEDIQKDTTPKINIDSLNKARDINRLKGSKSAIIFDSRDFRRNQKAIAKKLKDSTSKANK